MLAMFRKPLPDQQRLIERLDYDPDSGQVTWRPLPPTSRSNKRFNACLAGKPAGSLTPSGYLEIGFDGSIYRLHRCIMKMMHGIESPYTDHADRNKLNNRLANLRPCTAAESSFNRVYNNSSGFRGIVQERSGNWRARVMLKGKHFNFGIYHDKRDAARAAKHGRRLLHGHFAHDAHL